MPRPSARRLLLAPSYPPPLAITITSNVTWDAVTTGQPYQVDVYAPTVARSPAPPALIVAHGGFDGTETKSSNSNVVIVAQMLAKAGYVVFAPNWFQGTPSASLSLNPNQSTHFQAFITWLRANAATYHADGTRIGVVGCSGGGNNGAVAAMVGVAGGTRPDALADWSGPEQLFTMPLTGSQPSTYQICASYCGVDYRLREAVLADGPGGYWRLGEPSGTSAADETGNGNTGTYTAAPTLGVAGALSGDTNTAVTFDGATQFVQIANATNINYVDTFTLEFRFKRSATLGTLQAVMAKGTNSGLVRFNASDQLELVKSGGAVIGHTAAVFQDTNWHHAVITKAGATSAIYVDGGASDFVLIGNQTCASSSAQLVIGTAQGTFFSGTLDEVAVYKTALSQARAAAHYQAIGNGAANEVIWNAVGGATLTPPAALCPVFVTGSAADTVPLAQGQAFLSNIAGISGVDATFFPLGTLPVANVHGASLWPYVLFTCAAWLSRKLSFPTLNLWGRDLVA